MSEHEKSPEHEPHDGHDAPHGEHAAPAEKKAGGGKPASRRRLLIAGGAVAGVAVIAVAAVFALKRPASEAAAHGEGAAHGEHAAHEEHAVGEEGESPSHEQEASAHEGHAALHEEHASEGHESAAPEQEGAGHGEHASDEHSAGEHSVAAGHHAEATEEESIAEESPSPGFSPIAEESRFHAPEWAEPLVRAWNSARDKADVIREALEENRRLRLENANLRVQAETLKMDCRMHEASEATAATSEMLVKQTGDRAGRVLASIKYRPPTHLLPPQLYTLATSYFRAEDYEKAAVILTLLTEMEENTAYRTAKNLVMLGVSWLRVDNPQLADEAFSRALDEADRPENLSYLAQARLWKAVLSSRQGKSLKVQYWLRELVDRHPHSIEASWVNPAAAKAKAESESAERVPASMQEGAESKAPAEVGHAHESKKVEAGGGEETGHHGDHSSHAEH